ncbi:MAG: hypothetical protein WBF66_04810 [Dehalococcoidia bacterium]
MSTLPKPVHERLKSEFRVTASKVAEARDIRGKIYYFSAFFGEASRQLNIHWHPDLALLWMVAQGACQAVNSRGAQTGDADFPFGGFPDGLPQAINEVSNELAVAFEGEEMDVPRLYAALARAAELAYAMTGNGAYLCDKGMIRI